MSIVVTDRIISSKFNQFHDILAATGGRYIRSPVLIDGYVIVHYEAGDYNAQCEAWHRVCTPIVEINSNQWWRVLLRRCGIRC